MHVRDWQGRRRVAKRLTLPAAALVIASAVMASAANGESFLPVVDSVSRQHLTNTAERVARALDQLGSPLAPVDRARLEASAGMLDDDAIGAIQAVLDDHCLVGVEIDEEGWIKVRPAHPDPNTRRLVQHQWRTFLIKIHNDGGFTTPLEVTSPHALALSQMPDFQGPASPASDDRDGWSKWTLLRLVQEPPMQSNLSGKSLDYMILQVYSLDSGMRAADITFRLGGGLVRRGHYADTSMLFYVDDAKPAPAERK